MCVFLSERRGETECGCMHASVFVHVQRCYCDYGHTYSGIQGVFVCFFTPTVLGIIVYRVIVD